MSAALGNGGDEVRHHLLVTAMNIIQEQNLAETDNDLFSKTGYWVIKEYLFGNIASFLYYFIVLSN